MLLLCEGQHLLLSDFNVSCLASTTAKDDPLSATLVHRHAHMRAHAYRSPYLEYLWPRLAGGGIILSIVPTVIGSYLDLASSTRGRILAAFTAPSSCRYKLSADAPCL